MDCMEGMKQFPDKFFDLAIVDPPYGGVTQGGYMKNKMGGGAAKNRNDYHFKLYEWLLNKYAKPGDIILDTHVGSASSLIACHNTHHRYVGFEIDPVYYRMAKKRLNDAEAQMNIFDYLDGGNDV